MSQALEHLTDVQLLQAQTGAPIPDDSVTVTCSAPVNIAVIKYWGKRVIPNSNLLVPINSSLSAAIDQGSMKSLTTITASRSFAKDTMFLNDKEEKIEANPRMVDVIQLLRKRAQALVVDGVTKIAAGAEAWADYKLRIVSHNNFPTAAGLASSASGYACFTRCLAELYGVSEEFEGELSAIARQGSGSACRSLYGGWVAWDKGVKADGTDSVARVVQPASHWPDMRVLILVANSGQKETSSTDGMARSVENSVLLAHRAASVVPERMEQMERFIRERDFASFAKLTMQDSNQFHATCLDTYPPIFYMNETSKSIIHLVHAFNKDVVRAAYTFDAGPNAVVFVLKEHMEELLAFFLTKFPHPREGDKVKEGLEGKERRVRGYLHDPMRLSSYAQQDAAAASSASSGVYISTADGVKPPATSASLEAAVGKNPHTNTTVFQIIVSKVGDGPQILNKKNTFKH